MHMYVMMRRYFVELKFHPSKKDTVPAYSDWSSVANPFPLLVLCRGRRRGLVLLVKVVLVDREMQVIAGDHLNTINST